MTDPLKRIAILGSTGSIGTQTLEVIRNQKDTFSVEVLTSFNNAALLAKQVREFSPNVVVIGDESKLDMLRRELSSLPVKIFAGEEALSQVVQMNEIDIVLTALVGYAGLKPTLSAIRAGKHIALANKETLVVAGELVTGLARKHSVNIYPVDSEHSAIFQCMAGEWNNPIEKIYLTASGGPFRGKDRNFLSSVKKEQALKHPNWDMGAKITVDSATLMNKGLEMIEARWLFGLRPEQIDVIVHPQSIVHSLVQYEDGSLKAQMGLPDMKLPIQYALGYPKRLKNSFTRFDFLKYPSLTFEKADTDTFRNLVLATEALQKGGNLPCIINAANEVAVEAFLKDQTGFLQMSDIIEYCMMKIPWMEHPTYDDYVETDRETRKLAASRLSSFRPVSVT
ncbi:MAG: 1-deoxy-D-xylulose-5-phosphate reductoisomerase [Bacteroidia bacterium]|nr:1-deoxy-D-xylulose-5-phosphate reductoisomerase [Bacteroidia bacterium]